MRTWLLAASVAAMLAVPAQAAAETLAVGVFAPAAPFASTEARLDWANRLARHLAAAAGYESGVGRVYAKAGDFAGAAKRGDFQVGVVDAAYLARSGAGWKVLAASVRGGQSESAWELVAASGATKVIELSGKTLMVPSIGGHEEELVLHALFGSEVQKGFFAKIAVAPDAVSAAAAVGLGRADAACVPAGLTLPAGVSRVTSLPELPWPLLVAMPGLGDDAAGRIAAAAKSFSGGDVLAGFVAAEQSGWRGLGKRFQKLVKRGPFLVPALKLAVSALLEGRVFAIEPMDARGYAAKP